MSEYGEEWQQWSNLTSNKTLKVSTVVWTHDLATLQLRWAVNRSFGRNQCFTTTKHYFHPSLAHPSIVSMKLFYCKETFSHPQCQIYTPPDPPSSLTQVPPRKKYKAAASYSQEPNPQETQVGDSDMLANFLHCGAECVYVQNIGLWWWEFCDAGIN
jgi:hypothetical protein